MNDETVFIRNPRLAASLRARGLEEVPSEVEGVFGFRVPVVGELQLLTMAAQSQQVQ
jgi:hypothetical protein